MREQPPSRPGIRTWLAAWALFGALGVLWALAAPVLSVADEPSHVAYAAAAVRGEVWAPAEGTVTVVTVPADFADINSTAMCYAFLPTQPAGCAEALTDRPGEAQVGTGAGREPPLYYAYAGLGSLVTSGAEAVYAMRLLTVLLVAACLASAVCTLLARPHPGRGLAGLALAVTPMVVGSAGSVGPQGPEVALAILVWVSGAAVLVDLRDDPDRPLSLRNPDLRRLLLAAVLLPQVRSASVLWLLAVLGLLLVAFGSRPALSRLLRARPVRAALPALALSVGVAVFWAIGRNSLGDGAPGGTMTGLPADQALQLAVTGLDDELRQLVGLFGWQTAPAPNLVYALYAVLLGAFLALAASGARRRQLIAVGVAVATGTVVSLVLAFQAHRTGSLGWSGAATLPVAVGIPLLLAVDGRDAALSRGTWRRFAVVAVTGVAVCQALAFTGTLGRHLFGIGGFWGLRDRGWSPPLPDWLLVAAEIGVLVAAVVAVATRRGTAGAEVPPGAGPASAPAILRAPLASPHGEGVPTGHR